MKMLSFLVGELSNSALYFSTFANAARNEANDYKKFCLGYEHFWKPFPYLKRIDDARKVEHKRSQPSSKKILPSTAHSKLLAFIAKDLRSRRYQFPLIGKYIDVKKQEPLHLKNNTIKERFMILFKIVMAESRLWSAKSFKDVPGNSLLRTFVSFLRKKNEL